MASEASEAREPVYVPHTEILERCEIIQKCINSAKLFKDGISFKYKLWGVQTASRFGFLFYLNVYTYASAEYTSERGVQHLNHAHIRNVDSSLGHYTGTFLLNIQLLMCYLSNITDITLHNYTADPPRGAKGIYKQFNVNQRGKSRNEFIGKTRADRLNASEGAMRLQTPRDLPKVIQSDLLEISTSERVTKQTEENPWNPDYEAHMKHFFHMLKQHYSQLGGSIKKSARKRSTRKKCNTRKRSNKKKNVHA